MKITGLFKPEYIYQPRKLLSRLIRRKAAYQRGGKVLVTLNCGLPIEVDPGEVIGQSVVKFGLFDLATSEVLWRLIEPGDTVIDIGANIGVMTALMAARVGSHGKVLAFEAHPIIYQDLIKNIALWGQPANNIVVAHNIALSAGAAALKVAEPASFAVNRGTARVLCSRESLTGPSFEVTGGRLSDYLRSDAGVKLVKMDVEGHEEFVLRGAGAALTSGRIENWVFEENAAYPSPVTEVLERAGYEIFRIHKGFRGATLSHPKTPVRASTWESPNFLATRCAEKVLTLFYRRGWRCLQRR